MDCILLYSCATPKYGRITLEGSLNYMFTDITTNLTQYMLISVNTVVFNAVCDFILLA